MQRNTFSSFHKKGTTACIRTTLSTMTVSIIGYRGLDTLTLYRSAVRHSAERHSVVFHPAVCHSAVCHSAVCHSAVCYSAECFSTASFS
jgi:hypothetical protein